MASSRPMRLHIIGATRRTRQTLEMLFQNTGKGAYSVVAESRAEAVILDLDGLQAEQEWLSYHHQHPGQLAVGLSLRPRQVAGVVDVLKKPVKSRDLMAALRLLRQAARNHRQHTPGSRDARAEGLRESASQGTPPPPRKAPKPQDNAPVRVLKPAAATVGDWNTDSKTTTRNTSSEGHSLSQPQTLTSFFDITAISQPSPKESLKDKYQDVCGVADDIDTTDEERLDCLFLDTRDHLLSHLLAATNSYAFIRLPQRLRINDRHFITLDNASTLFTNIDDVSLQRLGRAHLTADDVRLSTVPEDEDLSDTHSRSIRIGLAPFQWKLALWTYRGRLPAGTDISARIYIKHWPNFTRLLECPDAMRIAALWSEQPMTLHHTAQALKIPQRHVFAFYSAMHAVGLAGQARRESDQLFEEPSLAKPPAGRGFFRRMLSHLHAGFTQDERQRGIG